MKIWKLLADVNNFDSLMPADPLVTYESHLDEGKSMIDNWEPLELKRMNNDMPLSDFPYFYGSPVMSDKAIVTLRPVMQGAVEYLDLIFDENKYSMINVIKLLDVVDYNKAKFVKFSCSNKILAFEKYSFRMCNELQNSEIFKIVDEPRRSPFVSDKFKKIVEDNGLTGFVFELVWDSDVDRV